MFEDFFIWKTKGEKFTRVFEAFFYSIFEAFKDFSSTTINFSKKWDSPQDNRNWL